VSAQKNFLGEHLYMKVKEVDEEMAGRIVGMVLDAFTVEQMVQNLQSESALKDTISRAIVTIKEHDQEGASK